MFALARNDPDAVIVAASGDALSDISSRDNRGQGHLSLHKVQTNRSRICLRVTACYRLWLF